MAINGAEALKNFELNQYIYMNHTPVNGGLLPDDRRAHACWHYCRMATKNLQDSDEGATYQGERDRVDMTNNLARAVCLQYRLDSPDDFLQFMQYCKAEVEREGGTWDSRIERPFTKDQIKVAN